MKRSSKKIGNILLLASGLAIGSLGCAGSDETSEAQDSEVNSSDALPRLLALGDSISYGWHPDWNPDQPNQPRNPANLQKAVLDRGYPERVGRALGLTTDNASCPGEASGSFLSAVAKDNGC